MKIGIDIDNTITKVQGELNNAAYKYAMKLGKNIENTKTPFEDIENNGDAYKKDSNLLMMNLNIF